ncbi:putative bifunctional diguanylate cyclase/phosphodiesterase [Crocosphaera watsonii]|uniref:Diguanylate cyclase/phosphodiesterase (GGDEF & EAL domains) with PAS/PAC sensor(S) n=1 Tax=Crocosphaera watsonii WH 8502 TaxID=423474 RepID=T2IKJ7_CROWT|nr:EAL domain-containing protein [Crocosphaera watsonii]CCQ53307.1 diguanylate cyclase/phosphodiesterase (GGDEF & EAL domains) with PAS/PAC sensor(s) [Crocosphaera watsonii WH 8502]
MYVMPLFTSREQAMKAMMDLHLNASWVTTLFGLGFTVVGLCSLVSKLLPETYNNLRDLQVSEAQIRQFNFQLGTAIKERTLELETTNNKLATEIEQRKVIEQKLQHDALHDNLTKLPNRSFLMTEINESLQKSKTDQDYQFVVLFIDIDRFKVINDSLGHHAGDTILVEISQRICQTIDNLGRVFRLTGDEFVVLLKNINSSQKVLQITNKIIEQIQLPIYINNLDFFTTVSIGIVFGRQPYCYDYEEGIEILRDADNAMYKAKEKGRNRYCVFDQTMHKEALKTLLIQTDLKKALIKEELILYYQPIISLSTQELIGFEALVRWNHPQEGLIPPIEFISLAEETGLIIDLGNWVFFEACRQAQVWKKQYEKAASLKISINLSGHQINEVNLVENIDRICNLTQLDPKFIRMEITENILIKNHQIINDLFQQIKERKIQICIDDFGTGYSSLSYLHNFELDILKIDKSFIQRNLNELKTIKILKTIIDVAYNFGMDVVAEGIETEQQSKILQDLGCKLGQGYFFGHPLNAKIFEKTWFETEQASLINY